MQLVWYNKPSVVYKMADCLRMLQRDALFYNASAEIGVGFYLVVMILTPRRAIMNTFAYWHWLRMRYASPDSAAQHSMVSKGCTVIFTA